MTARARYAVSPTQTVLTRRSRLAGVHQLDAGHVVGEELGAEPLGLLAHVVHQLGAHDAVREAGEVLHLGGGHQRAAGLHALDDQRLQVGAGGVDRRGVAGRPGADDDQVADLVHCRLPSCVFGVGASTDADPSCRRLGGAGS